MNKFINKKTIGIIHKVYINQLKNSKKYLASTKTRKDVRGGGKKPWKQKGTGRARAGSLRSPLFVGGGIIFGPKYKIVKKKINKKEKKIAIISALYLKKKNSIFIDYNINFNFSTVKSKDILNFILKLDIKKTDKILFVLENPNKFFWLATRNFKNITVTTLKCINIKDILNSKYLILSKDYLAN